MGQEEGEASSGEKWQVWDLKPMDYFFPERDIAGGKLASEANKSKLADKFDDDITITDAQAQECFDCFNKTPSFSLSQVPSTTGYI